MIAGAAVKIAACAQRTRRVQIEHVSAVTIAEAMARCLDDTHAAGGRQTGTASPEAASVRAAALVTLVQMPVMLAVIGVPDPGQEPQPYQVDGSQEAFRVTPLCQTCMRHQGRMRSL